MPIKKSLANWFLSLAYSLLFCVQTLHIAFASEVVSFPSLYDNTHLTAYLSQPVGSGPFPTVVLLHGCGGSNNINGIKSIYASWAKLLNDNGMATLIVDSAGSRNLGATCVKGKNRIRMYRERPFDAYGALGYLQSLDIIQPDKVGLLGWSQGGGVTLLSIVTESFARPVPAPDHDFAVAAVFYPALCNDRMQSRPFTKRDPHSWSTKIPLLVLFGAADNWTRPEPCQAFIEEVQERGSPVSIVFIQTLITVLMGQARS